MKAQHFKARAQTYHEAIRRSSEQDASELAVELAE
jgi:hypothetical protein